MRKLSYIERVLEVRPVHNSDNLDVVLVRGWRVVTKRGEFSVGDLCVYFEIDSVLPASPLFEFLKPRGYRIKTIKLRGQVSQGLVVHLDEIKKHFTIDISEIGTCLDDVIGVKHVDELSKDDPNYRKSNFPCFIHKTDEERIQNIPLHLVQNQLYEVSVKLDGSSMTVFYNNGQYGVCSRNILLNESDDSKFTHTANHIYGLKTILQQYCSGNGRNLAIQGELIGEGIQGNKENIKGWEYYVFNVWDIDKQEYLPPSERFKVVTDLGLESVPILFDEPFLITEDMDKDYIISMADGESLNAKVREGIVFKRIDGQFSFKAISNKFLLKY